MEEEARRLKPTMGKYWERTKKELGKELKEIESELEKDAKMHVAVLNAAAHELGDPIMRIRELKISLEWTEAGKQEKQHGSKSGN